MHIKTVRLLGKFLTSSQPHTLAPALAPAPAPAQVARDGAVSHTIGTIGTIACAESQTGSLASRT